MLLLGGRISGKAGAPYQAGSTRDLPFTFKYIAKIFVNYMLKHTSIRYRDVQLVSNLQRTLPRLSFLIDIILFGLKIIFLGS